MERPVNWVQRSHIQSSSRPQAPGDEDKTTMKPEKKHEDIAASSRQDNDVPPDLDPYSKPKEQHASSSDNPPHDTGLSDNFNLIPGLDAVDVNLDQTRGKRPFTGPSGSPNKATLDRETDDFRRDFYRFAVEVAAFMDIDTTKTKGVPVTWKGHGKNYSLEPIERFHHPTTEDDHAYHLRYAREFASPKLVVWLTNVLQTLRGMDQSRASTLTWRELMDASQKYRNMLAQLVARLITTNSNLQGKMWKRSEIIQANNELIGKLYQRFAVL